MEAIEGCKAINIQGIKEIYDREEKIMEILKAIMAFIPMIWLLISLGVLKIPTHKACLWAVIINGGLSVVRV